MGLGGLAVAGAVGLELVDHGVLPGKSLLDELDGACDVDVAAFRIRRLGASLSGSFYSRHRRRVVGYSVGYPPGTAKGDALPLVVMLHGYGDDHRTALAGLSPAQAVALVVDGAPLPAMALATVDGGDGYWHPHPGDDPMGMVVDELLPMLASLGLGDGHRRVATMGISMGGYGAILLAERFADRFAAVAAISPAIWTTYPQAQGANAGAFDSAAQFAAFDVVTHAAALGGTPVRVASGLDDPFHPGVVALCDRLGPADVVVFSGGCHTSSFFESQEPPSLRFLGEHLAS